MTTLTTPPQEGTAELADVLLIYEPDAFTGVVTLGYTTCIGEGTPACDAAVVRITVLAAEPAAAPGPSEAGAQAPPASSDGGATLPPACGGEHAWGGWSNASRSRFTDEIVSWPMRPSRARRASGQSGSQTSCQYPGQRPRPRVGDDPGWYVLRHRRRHRSRRPSVTRGRIHSVHPARPHTVARDSTRSAREGFLAPKTGEARSDVREDEGAGRRVRRPGSACEVGCEDRTPRDR